MSLSGEEYKDYETKFDPAAYVEMGYPKVPEGTMPFVNDKESVVGKFILKCLSDYFRSTKASNNLKVLDYGCGPVVLHLTSAVPKAAEIVLAEYATQNRKFVQKWVDRETEGNIFSPYFKYVVEILEGGSEEDAMKREDELRSKVTAVVPCDITKERVIAEGYEGPYDVLFCSLVLEVACKDFESYAIGIKKLALLIKEGGYLVLFSTIREKSDVGFYTVCNEKFYYISLNRKIIITTLENNGFCDLNYEFMPLIPNKMDNNEGLFFISAKKKVN